VLEQTMKTIAIVLPSIVLALAVGLIVTTEGTPSALFTAPTADVQNVGIFGHVEFVHKNADGYVVSYYQADNLVMDDGKNCVLTDLFAQATGACTTSAAGFTFIGLGNGTCVSCEDATRTDVEVPMVGTDGVRQEDTDTTTPAFTAALAGASGIAIINTESPFNIGASNETANIFEAGLFDAVTGGNAFAIRNTTAATPNLGIDVNAGDTLDVTWTINVG